MTDELKEALADLNRTMRDIRAGNTRFPTGRQDGDFFSFPTPGREPATDTHAPKPDSPPAKNIKKS